MFVFKLMTQRFVDIKNELLCAGLKMDYGQQESPF
jgi:hypothetical protein